MSPPSARTQRFLAWIGVIGVLTACFGCGLVVRNEIRAAIIFLIAAQCIIVPLFIYLISIRRGTKRVVRNREAVRSEQRQAELDALGEMFGPGADEGPQTTDDVGVKREM
jgi:NhaP-type Na+/H+ or K+/H+ antiporter